MKINYYSFLRALGGLFAAIFSIILYLISDSNNLWRIQFLLGALGAIPIFLMRRNIPESPRWLIFKGKYDEAKRIIEFIKYCCEKNKYVNCGESEQESAISI